MSEYDEMLHRFMAYVVAQPGWAKATVVGQANDPESGTTYHVREPEQELVFQVHEHELRDHDAAGNIGALAATKTQNASADPQQAPGGGDEGAAPPTEGDASIQPAPAMTEQALVAATDPGSMTRGQRARFAAQVLDELRQLTLEDPAFDAARGYLHEARQVLPTKAE